MSKLVNRMMKNHAFQALWNVMPNEEFETKVVIPATKFMGGEEFDETDFDQDLDGFMSDVLYEYALDELDWPSDCDGKDEVARAVVDLVFDGKDVDEAIVMAEHTTGKEVLERIYEEKAESKAIREQNEADLRWSITGSYATT